MLDSARKSFNEILKERLSSPLWGALIISWSVINWKIIYLTLFVSEGQITGTKINYIIEHYYDRWDLLWYPSITAIGLITLFPFVAIGAYWTHLKFREFKKNLKNKIENNQMLSIDESNEFRRRMRQSEVEFNQQYQIKVNELNGIKTDFGNYKEFTENAVASKDASIEGLQKDLTAAKSELSQLKELSKGDHEQYQNKTAKMEKQLSEYKEKLEGEDKLIKTIQENNITIKELNEKISKLQQRKKPSEGDLKEFPNLDDISDPPPRNITDYYNSIKKFPGTYNSMRTILPAIKITGNFPLSTPQKVIDFYLKNNAIEASDRGKITKYKLTETGLTLLELLLSDEDYVIYE